MSISNDAARFAARPGESARFHGVEGAPPRGRFVSTLCFVACVIGVASTCSVAAQSSGRYPGIGRPATEPEITAWNIDVRTDFAGLPRGSGSVDQGARIWDEKCASCHGSFGESNEVFNPIVGGTTADDVKSGVVKSLTTTELQRTTMMKLASLATLWDYIRRAMPWTAPKSLMNDEVYAVSAYILHLADLVPAGFVLSDSNIRETQNLLPNRKGMTTAHGLWNVRGKPDVRSTACMRDCETDSKIHSSIPEHARNAHGNLAQQNRTIGGVRGVETSTPGSAASLAAAPRRGTSNAPLTLATEQGCLACHGVDRKVVGPGFREIAARYARTLTGEAAHDSLVAELATKIRSGTAGGWGSVPMPAQGQLTSSGAELLARWIASGAPSP